MPWIKLGWDGWVHRQFRQNYLTEKSLQFGMDGKSQPLKHVCWGGGRVQTHCEKEQGVFLDKDKTQGYCH